MFMPPAPALIAATAASGASSVFAIRLPRTFYRWRSRLIATARAAIGDAVAQAGAYCHAKGQKYVRQTAAKGQITFKCVPNPQ